MEFEKLLRLMVEKGGSDLFITTGVAPSMKINGRIMRLPRAHCHQKWLGKWC